MYRSGKMVRFGMFIVACALSASTAFAEPTVQIVYSFTGNNGTSDGNDPAAPLLKGRHGEFIGTTAYGGASTHCQGGGCGTVFKVKADGTETVLHSFSGGSDGALPVAGLIRGRNGYLYGTTQLGGGGAGCLSDSFIQDYGSPGCGTVFSISPDGVEQVIYAFTGINGDGWLVVGGLVQDSNGNLYGATAAGGAYQAGMVFEITAAGTEVVLYSFTGADDGSEPFGGVTLGPDGALYGVTWNGGAAGLGTVYRVTTDGTEQVLWTFNGGPADGAYPQTGLLLAGDGNFYGSTSLGGTFGYGAFFKITTAGALTLIYSSPSPAGSPTGQLAQDAAGNLFGTTQFGGSTGYGSVFELDTNGVFTTLVDFPGWQNGGVSNPGGGVTLGKDGWLWGTSSLGGSIDGGAVFRVRIPH